MNLKHIISVNQFDTNFLENLFRKAVSYSEVNQNSTFSNSLSGKIVANLFYEPSTRTSSSFFAAATKLGGSVLPINEVTYSSVAKGESLKDTIITLGCYADAIILRHGSKGAAQEAAQVSNVPIINAGDGDGEHPTQALLDLFTIFKEKQNQSVGSLRIGMMGDLKHGRTVHSLTKLLRLYNPKLHFIAPKEFQMPDEYIRIGDSTHEGLEEVLELLDVLYVTRVQKERHSSAIDYKYMITPETLIQAKSNLTIMHPLPRVGEIHEDVDQDPRAAYFRQMKNGLWVRMALLDTVLA